MTQVSGLPGKLLLLVVLITFGAGAGYWFGRRVPAERTDAAAATAGAGKAERKPLYYRNPMGLPDTSPVPKKDSMGMDYVPVFADGDEAAPAAAGTLSISSEKVQMLGVRTEAAALRTLGRTVRAVARIEADERRSYTISPKFEGYVDRLHVNVTGQTVRRGQALFEAYSPELVSAQREYVIARDGVRALGDAGDAERAGMQQLADSGLIRLRNWDVPEEQIRTLAESGEVRRTLTFRSPVGGVVTEKRAIQGMRFMPGDALYQVADLSTVWVIADIFEQDSAVVRPGALARVTINAYPDRTFEGKVSYIYPTLNVDTRTVPVRIELANGAGLLKPGMFADVTMSASGGAPVVTVPLSAVIDSGVRRIVFVQRAPGRFEPREVRLGARSSEHVEVLSGIDDGESVVVTANFLIDAESNLKAAIGSFAPPAGPDGTASGSATRESSAPRDPGHRAEGKIDLLAPDGTSVVIRHRPVDTLQRPAMTMTFKLANPAVAAGVQPGETVTFEFVERKPGEWVVTSIQRAGRTARAAPHTAH